MVWSKHACKNIVWKIWICLIRWWVISTLFVRKCVRQWFWVKLFFFFVLSIKCILLKSIILPQFDILSAFYGFCLFSLSPFWNCVLLCSVSWRLQLQETKCKNVLNWGFFENNAKKECVLWLYCKLYDIAMEISIARCQLSGSFISVLYYLSIYIKNIA